MTMMTWTVTSAAILSGAVTSLWACKPRQDFGSDTKQIFAQDQGEGSWREVGVAPQDYPFMLSIDRGCAGFILDKTASIAMTAAHCHPRVGSSLQFGTRQRWVDDQSGQGEIHGEITQILESSPRGELDYAIFKYQIIPGQPQPTLGEVKLSADETKLTQLQRSGEFIYMTGYPSDPIAASKLSLSKCHIRSPITTTSHAQYWLPQWRALVAAWEAPQSPYKQNPSEYAEMRDCFSEIAAKDYERFFYDCSVYGGNSGGPVYYQKDNPVVIGLPASYLATDEDKAKLKAGSLCRERFHTKYIVPITQTLPQMPPQPAVNQERTWNNTDRNTTNIQNLPFVVPMARIVAKSAYIRQNPSVIYREPPPPPAQPAQPIVQQTPVIAQQPPVVVQPPPPAVDIEDSLSDATPNSYFVNNVLGRNIVCGGRKLWFLGFTKGEQIGQTPSDQLYLNYAFTDSQAASSWKQMTKEHAKKLIYDRKNDPFDTARIVYILGYAFSGLGCKVVN